MEQLDNPEELFKQAQAELEKRRIFNLIVPNYDRAILAMESAGSLFEMRGMNKRAADAYLRAAGVYVQHEKQDMAMNLVNQAVQCYCAENAQNAIEPLRLLIQLSRRAGRHLQAGKAALIVAEHLEDQGDYDIAHTLFETAAELLSTEANADAELRNARLRMAALEALRKGRYSTAAATFRDIAGKCVQMPILRSHANALVFKALLCALLHRRGRLEPEDWQEYFYLLSGTDAAQYEAFFEGLRSICADVQGEASIGQALTQLTDEHDAALGIRASVFNSELITRLGVFLADTEGQRN